MPGFEPGTSPTRTARATRLRYDRNRVSEPMRVLCLGLDGADYDLVRKLLAQGRLPTLARLSRQGHSDASGPRSRPSRLRRGRLSSPGSTLAGHGIFAFTSNPNRGGGRLESAASRAGAPLWRYLGAAGIRSAFVTIPFTHPPEPTERRDGHWVRGTRRPEIVPLGARNAILTAHPDLRSSRHPSDLETSQPRQPRSGPTSRRSQTSASSPSSSSPTSVFSVSTS